MYTGYPTWPQPLLLWPARSGLPKSPHAARGSQPASLDAGGREWARVALKDKELHKPQFFACPPHKSVIYIHNFTYFQVHTKCILCGIINYLIRFEDGYRTPHEINKPYEFNWTKINVVMYLPYWNMWQWAFVPWKRADCTCSECNFLGLFMYEFLMWIFCFFTRNICFFFVCAHVLTCWC